MAVREERTGWRDEKISALHRVWGWNCPAVDIDWLVIEYDKSKPIAIIEYKNEHAKPQLPNHPSYRALAELGTLANLPFFAVRYADDFTWWKVIPLNMNAKNIIKDTKEHTQLTYVTFLYDLRGRKIPEDIVNRIIDTDLQLI